MEYNILMKRYNGATWDVLRPLTLSDNVSDENQTNKFVNSTQQTWIESLRTILYASGTTEINLDRDTNVDGILKADSLESIGDLQVGNNSLHFTSNNAGFIIKHKKALSTPDYIINYETTSGKLFLEKPTVISSPSANAGYNPTNGQDLTTKTYVDNLQLGVKPKSAMKVRTTTNVALTGIANIDGVVLEGADRVLLVAQTTPSENGIYTFLSGNLSKVSTTENETGALVSITQGTTGAGERWYCLNYGEGLWIQFDSQIDIQPGSGITVSGATVSISNSAITNAMLAGSISATKLSLGSALENQSGNLNVKNGTITNEMLAGSINVSKLLDFQNAENTGWGNVQDATGAAGVISKIQSLITAIRTLRGTSTYNFDNNETIIGAYTKIENLSSGKNSTSISNANPPDGLPAITGRAIGDLHFQYES